MEHWTAIFNKPWKRIFRVICSEYGWSIDYVARLTIKQINAIAPVDEEEDQKKNEIQITSPEGLKKEIAKMREDWKKKDGKN